MLVVNLGKIYGSRRETRILLLVCSNNYGVLTYVVAHNRSSWVRLVHGLLLVAACDGLTMGHIAESRRYVTNVITLLGYSNKDVEYTTCGGASVSGGSVKSRRVEQKETSTCTKSKHQQDTVRRSTA